MKILFISVISVLFVLLACNSKPEQVKQTQTKPNIVFIIGDDIGCYDLTVYGNKNIKTPNIDHIAQKGMVFNNMYLTASSCSPSRVSIITGRYPHNTGACELHSPLPANQLLFPEILRKNGYYTAQAGKWHFGSIPQKQNNDTIGLGPALRAFDRISVSHKENGDGGEAMWIKLLQERPKNKPFFMWFAAYDAHRPWEKANAFQLNCPDSVWVPGFLFNGDSTRYDLAKYYNEISRFDYYIGLVEQELIKQGVAGNTIIIITSDNGRPFPRSKTRVYDSGIKTPFIIKYPKLIKEKQQTTALASIIDLAPTLINLAGIDVPAEFQGKSFAEILQQPDSEHRTYIYAEHNWHDYEAYERMVRTKDFMYIINKRPWFDMLGPADAVVSLSMHELYRAHEEKKLNDYQKNIFLKPRPKKEFFNCAKDKFQYYNRINDTTYLKQITCLQAAIAEWQETTNDTEPVHLTPDHFDRKTGARLFKGFKWGEMPGKKLRADTVKCKI
jgi:arylsulfatase A-like enzyme